VGGVSTRGDRLFAALVKGRVAVARGELRGRQRAARRWRPAIGGGRLGKKTQGETTRHAS